MKLNAIQYLFHRGGCYVFPNGQVLRHCEEVCGLPPFGGSGHPRAPNGGVKLQISWAMGVSFFMGIPKPGFKTIHGHPWLGFQLLAGCERNQPAAVPKRNQRARRWLWVGTQWGDMRTKQSWMDSPKVGTSVTEVATSRCYPLVICYSSLLNMAQSK